MLGEIHQFFEYNSLIILFIYGQVFFVLGLIITLQSRSHSRLELGRHLSWLGAFGLAHGFHEWGLLFIPIQAAYMSPATIELFTAFQTVLLALSFCFLFQFGVELLHFKWPRLIYLPIIVFLTWLGIFFVPGIRYIEKIDLIFPIASIWARYIIGFPGALLSAIGLLYQSRKSILPLGLKNIDRTFSIASFALLGYSIFGGLIVPAANFFPANILNEELFYSITGISLPIFRSLIGLVMAICIIRGLEVFQIELNRHIDEAKYEIEVNNERERIARDLHDGTVQIIYTAGLLVESVQRKLTSQSDLYIRLERAGTAINEAIEKLRLYVGSLINTDESVTLIQGIDQIVNNPRYSALIQIELKNNIPSEMKCKSYRISHILAVISEAITNAIRHGHAHLATIMISQEGDQLKFEIKDDGKGFIMKEIHPGFGLRNIRDRARLLGGTIDFISANGKGTSVILRVPIIDE